MSAHQLKIDSSSYYINLRKTIVFLLYCFILIDMINGYLLRSGIVSISPFFKFLTLFLIVIYFIKNIALIVQVNLLVLLILLYAVIHSYLLGDPIFAISGLDWIVKFSSIVIFYIFFQKVIDRRKGECIFQFAKYSFVFLLVNFTFGFFGFGYGMYGTEENSIGTRGFIFAGNEIGAALIVSGAILQMQLIEQRKYWRFVGVGILMIWMGVLLTSKVSIFSSMLLLLSFPMIKAAGKLKYMKIEKKDVFFSSLVILAMPAIASGAIYYVLFFSNLIERLSYFYDKVDIITLLLSNRNIWALEAINIYFDSYSILEILFGSGQSWIYEISDKKMVEIDFIDFLMTYGIGGAVVAYGFFAWILLKLIHNQTNPYFGYLLLMIVLLLGMSLTSGHIMNSGIAGALIAALLSMVNNKIRLATNENSPYL